jgi:hypothetical protein
MENVPPGFVTIHLRRPLCRYSLLFSSSLSPLALPLALSLSLLTLSLSRPSFSLLTPTALQVPDVELSSHNQKSSRNLSQSKSAEDCVPNGLYRLISITSLHQRPPPISSTPTDKMTSSAIQQEALDKGLCPFFQTDKCLHDTEGHNLNGGYVLHLCMRCTGSSHGAYSNAPHACDGTLDEPQDWGDWDPIDNPAVSHGYSSRAEYESALPTQDTTGYSWITCQGLCVDFQVGLCAEQDVSNCPDGDHYCASCYSDAHGAYTSCTVQPQV